METLETNQEANVARLCGCGAGKYGLEHIDHADTGVDLNRLLLCLPQRRSINRGMFKNHFLLIFDNGAEIRVPYEEGRIISRALAERALSQASVSS